MSVFQENILKIKPFADKTGLSFNGTGVKGVVPAGTTGNIDLLLNAPHCFNGIEILLKDHSFDDEIEALQVVATTPEDQEVVVSQFANHWNVDNEKQNQGTIMLDYEATIPALFKIRMKYKSTGENDVTIKANFFIHKIVSS